MTSFPISKSQTRLLALLSLTASDYTEAAQALQTAGFNEDGVPYAHTWRTAAKLTDAELLATSGRYGIDPDNGAVRRFDVTYNR